MKHILIVGSNVEFKDGDVFMNDIRVTDAVLTSSLDINKRLIYMDKFPPKKVIAESQFPIVVYYNILERYKIPKYIKDAFTVKYEETEMNIFKILSAIFYGKDRDAVYTLLKSTKPPTVLLFKWIECNAHRVWIEIPREVLTLDTLLFKMKQDMVYKYLAYSLPRADRRVQFRWIK